MLKQKVSQLSNFIDMLSSANVDFEQQDYIKEGEEYHDILMFLGKGYNAPHIEWVFNEDGQLLAVEKYIQK